MLFYSTIDPATLQLLKDLQDAEIEPMPKMIKNANWEEVKMKIMSEFKI